MLLFLDESGDLNSNRFVKNYNAFFTITILFCENNKILDNIKRAIRKTFNNKFSHNKSNKNFYELKGSKLSLGIKNYFLKLLPQNGWSVYSLTLDKNTLKNNVCKIDVYDRIWLS